MTELCLSSESRTHVGRVRSINEDRVLDRPDRGLWAIADGMGGHGGGDVAATLAVAALGALAAGPIAIGGENVMAALEAGNQAILDHNRNSGANSGTTIVALHVAHGFAELFWAGDSRAYRLRGRGAKLVTRDHSVVQDLVDAGLLAARDAERHPQAHVVTRALGIDAQPDIERRVIEVEAGDVFLLCSDGFSRGMTPDALASEIARVDGDANALLRGSVERDGSDNVSFALVRVDRPITG